MTAIEEALQMILNSVCQTGVERVPLQNALSRVLAEPVEAEMDIPPFDRSPLDGYALRAEETRGASPERPLSFKVIGTVESGSVPRFILKPRSCFRVMTGALLPGEVNTVIAQEKVSRSGDTVFVPVSLRPGTNIVHAGEDIRRGELVMEKGTMLGPVQVGILASLGKVEVKVYKKPLVAVLSSGSELVTPGERLGPGHIYDSNSALISAMVKDCGAEPVNIGPVKDDFETLSRKILDAQEAADAVVTTGGVSVGDSDLMAAVVRKIGARLLFWRVAVKPGTPMLAAVKKGKLLFCLSGNPAAAYVTFDQFVRCALLKMCGREDFNRTVVEAVLQHPLPANGGQNRFIRAVCTLQRKTFHVRPAGLERPGVLSSMQEANSFIFLPAGSPSLGAGQRVTVQLSSVPPSA